MEGSSLRPAVKVLQSASQRTATQHRRQRQRHLRSSDRIDILGCRKLRQRQHPLTLPWLDRGEGTQTRPTLSRCSSIRSSSQPRCAPGPRMLGWQQFIYSQNQCGGPCVFMEYWLINFGPACPTGPWIQAGNSCWFNSASSTAPAVTAAQLQGTTLTGNASGTTDSVVLTSPGGPATAIAADSVVNLSQSWNTAEWILCGDCCSTQANFNSGSTIVPRTRVIYGSGIHPSAWRKASLARPTTSASGRPLLPHRQPGRRSYSRRAAPAARGRTARPQPTVGDTHLATFNGLLYDFQASGDFVLAQVDPDFVVQTRQVSGAPTWPDASVNNAVATRMGKTTSLSALPGAA